jgi:DNA repair protein RecO (recombination protein O)
MKRTPEEPAFVLHRYDWSESSLILEVFTRHHGRVALAAKGAKRPHSSLRPVLLPLQPLHLAFSGDAEVRTLKGAEWVGGQSMPSGKALLTGFYVNELLLRLLAREDPHERLFDRYADMVRMIGRDEGTRLQAGLRAFELTLLREIGLLPVLDRLTLNLAPLEPRTRYRLVPDSGLREAATPDDDGLAGAQWLTLHEMLAVDRSWTDLLEACWPVHEALRRQTRTLLHYHCGGMNLRTREMMLELRDL